MEREGGDPEPVLTGQRDGLPERGFHGQGAVVAPEGFGIDAVKMGIRRFVHPAGRPVMIVAPALRGGHPLCRFLQIKKLQQNEENKHNGNVPLPDCYFQSNRRCNTSETCW